MGFIRLRYGLGGRSRSAPARAQDLGASACCLEVSVLRNKIDRSDQLLEHEPQPTPKQALVAEPYLTPAQLTQNIVSADPELRLWCVSIPVLRFS